MLSYCRSSCRMHHTEQSSDLQVRAVNVRWSKGGKERGEMKTAPSDAATPAGQCGRRPRCPPSCPPDQMPCASRRTTSASNRQSSTVGALMMGMCAHQNKWATSAAAAATRGDNVMPRAACQAKGTEQGCAGLGKLVNERTWRQSQRCPTVHPTPACALACSCAQATAHGSTNVVMSLSGCTAVKQRAVQNDRTQRRPAAQRGQMTH